jgi:hypothetical protein
MAFGDVLRGMASVLSPQVAQEAAQEDQQQRQMQSQAALLRFKDQLEQQSPEGQAKAQALKNELGYRDAMTKLPPDADYDTRAKVAAQFGKPELQMAYLKAKEDRAARLQMAADTIETRKLQLSQLHEQAQSRITDQQMRASEAERHNRSMEELTRQGNQIKQQLADFNAPQGQGGGTVENVAKMIAEGRLAPLSGFALKTPWGQQVMSKVTELNPDYQGQDYATKQAVEKAFTSGKQGNSVRSFNVALAHLDTLGGLADALDNGNQQLINKAANTISTQLGKPNANNFEAAKQIVADEIVKAIVGAGGGVSDRDKAQQTVSAANSPAQLRGVINTYKELMKGQLGGLRQQYEASTGKTDFDRFLSTEAKSVAHGTPSSQSAPTQGGLSPAEQAELDALRKRFKK